MVYDRDLAWRVEEVLARQTGIVKKQMFGVACYMRHGHAFAGVWNDALIIRTGPDAYEATLEQSYVREFDITGKPMRGWVVVESEAIDDDQALREWISRAVNFARTLPPKPKSHS